LDGKCEILRSPHADPDLVAQSELFRHCLCFCLGLAIERQTDTGDDDTVVIMESQDTLYTGRGIS
jgi:hypothetical protein